MPPFLGSPLPRGRKLTLPKAHPCSILTGLIRLPAHSMFIRCFNALLALLVPLAGAAPLFSAEGPSRTRQDGAEMVYVQARSFVMGSLDGEADEAPPRKVTLPAFYIDKCQVTHELYARFIAATGRKPPSIGQMERRRQARQSSGRKCHVGRRHSLRQVGRQASSDRSRVGTRRSRQRRSNLSLGQCRDGQTPGFRRRWPGKASSGRQLS